MMLVLPAPAPILICCMTERLSPASMASITFTLSFMQVMLVEGLPADNLETLC